MNRMTKMMVVVSVGRRDGERGGILLPPHPVKSTPFLLSCFSLLSGVLRRAAAAA